MGRLIDAITGKQNVVVLGKRQDRNVLVAGRPMDTLRARLSARLSRARLVQCVGEALWALRHAGAKPLTLGATQATEPTGFHARIRLHRRHSRPGCSLHRSRF